MTFEAGDLVVHWRYGLGEIIRLDEKVLFGNPGKYYVVQIRNLELWAPLDDAGNTCLRSPTPANDFQNLFALLASPGESLPDNRFKRQTKLTELLTERTLESICRVIRDLVYFRRNNKLTASDNSILKRSRNFLLDEWTAALSVPAHQAERELMDLLQTSNI